MSFKEVEKTLDPDFYRTLLESTKAIPWRIDWRTMTFSYIGPQIEQLLGWPAESWVSAQDWAGRIHEEDRQSVVNFCLAQSRDGVDHEADYRALKADGSYVWIRDVVHVLRKDGQVDSLVGFMFDISERKKNENELLRLKRELEELSYKDGLTNLANRRMFELVLSREWASAVRNRRPLSLIMLDIDFFKQYNDHYGHLHGDDCLKRVAEILHSCARRSQDLAARYGGEEFLMLLPDTDLAAARALAETFRLKVLEAKIPHEKSAVSGFLTVSLGVATIVPARETASESLIESVDKLLYSAKESGRNRVGVPAQ